MEKARLLGWRTVYITAQPVDEHRMMSREDDRHNSGVDILDPGVAGRARIGATTAIECTQVNFQRMTRLK